MHPPASDGTFSINSDNTTEPNVRQTKRLRVQPLFVIIDIGCATERGQIGWRGGAKCAGANANLLTLLVVTQLSSGLKAAVARLDTQRGCFLFFAIALCFRLRQ